MGIVDDMSPGSFKNRLQKLSLTEQECDSTQGPDSILPAISRYKLDLSSLELEHFPEELLDLEEVSLIKELYIDYNDLPQLQDELFSSCYRLNILSVIGNPLSSIPAAINSLTNLEELYLNECEITSLPEEFTQLCNLRVLNLTGNRLKLLPENFGNLSNLEQLQADENELSSLPDSFTRLSVLATLELEQNKLSNLPAHFGRLSKLNVLNLSSNKLSALPSSFRDLPAVEELDVSGNRIRLLPDRFGSTGCLRRLFCERCGLEEVPGWINRLPALEELSLRDNKIHNKPFTEDFPRSSKRLRTLDLSGNFMTDLPDNIGELVHLEEIKLGSVIDELERRAFQNGNWIKSLPQSFSGLASLRKARLDENQFLSLPLMIGNLKFLSFIDMGQNQLYDLPDSFCDLASLKMCLLSKNNITHLPDRFGCLSNLEELRLDNNQVSALPDSCVHLTNLKVLDLFNNYLPKLPECVKSLPNLLRLDVDENKFGLEHCDVPALHFRAQYAPRDPSKKSWRGRPRQDLVDFDDVNRMAPSSETVEFPEVVLPRYDEYVYRRAMEKNMSLWRSHGGPEKREKYKREDAEVRRRKMEEELSRKDVDPGDEDWEPPWYNANTSNSTTSNGSHAPTQTDSHTSGKEVVDSQPEPEEDWEKECEDWNPAPPQSQDTCDIFSDLPNINYDAHFDPDMLDMNDYIPGWNHVTSVSRAKGQLKIEIGQFDDADS